MSNPVLRWLCDPNTLTAIAALLTSALTFRLVKLNRDAIDLAKKDFISSKRPQIRIRQFHHIAPLAEGQRIVFGCVLVNCGDTDGTIYETCHAATVSEIRDMYGFPDYNELGVKRTLNTKLTNGDRVLEKFPSNCILTRQDLIDIQAETRCLLAYGYVTYKDGNGTIRSTAFFRHYNTKTGRFVVPEYAEPDYEYAE